MLRGEQGRTSTTTRAVQRGWLARRGGARRERQKQADLQKKTAACARNDRQEVKKPRRKPLPWEEPRRGCRGSSGLRSDRARALGSEWGAGSARRVADGRVGESVPHGDTHTSQAPVDDLSPAELTGACPTPIRCQALAPLRPSPLVLAALPILYLTPELRGFRDSRQLY